MADEKEVKPENKETVPAPQVAAPEPSPTDNTPNKPEEEAENVDNRPEEQKNPLLKKILKPNTSHEKHETGLDEMQNLANELQANTLNSGTIFDAYKEIKGKPKKPKAASSSEEEELNDDGVTYDPAGTSGLQDLDAEGSDPDDPGPPDFDPDNEDPTVALSAMEDSPNSPADAAGATPASAFPKPPVPTSGNAPSSPGPDMDADFESPRPGS